MINKNIVDNELLDIYFEDVGKVKRLNKEDEVEYSTQVRKWLDTPKAGGGTRKSGKEARELLIVSNLRLVIEFAKRYRGLGLDFSDLISEGNIGLMKAAEKYSPDRGTKFSYYAAFWIKQAIRLALSSKGRTIKLPRGSIEKKIKILNFMDEFECKNGRPPSKEEVAKFFKMTVKRLVYLQKMEFQIRSLNENERMGPDGEHELATQIKDAKMKTPSEQLLEKEKDQILNAFLKKLTKRQRFIIKNRFGLEGLKRRTLESIGKDLKVTRERIRQIESITLKKLRKLYEESGKK